MATWRYTPRGIGFLSLDPSFDDLGVGTPGTRRAWERHGLELMKLPDDVKLTALKSGSERSLPGSFGLSPQMVIVRHPGYHAQRLSFPNPNWGLQKVVPAPVPCYVSLVRYGQLYSRFFYSSSLPTAGWFVATMDDYVRTCMCGAPRGRESAARDRPIDMCSRLSALVCPRAVNGDVCVCVFPSLDCIVEKKVASQRPIVPSSSALPDRYRSEWAAPDGSWFPN